MNNILKGLHQFIIKTKAEELLVDWRRRVNFIRKFIPISLRHKFTSIGRLIPNSSDYTKDDCYGLIRDNTQFRINRSDYVQWRLFYGVRDHALRESKKHLESGSVVLDIGANFGAFSLRLANYIVNHKYSDIKIHAFEPNPTVFNNYQKNLSLNPNLTSVIHLYPIGLGNENGERSFNYSESNTGAGRIVDKSHGRIMVNLQRLDDFVFNLNPIKISFIKLIAEGFEPEILKGGWNTILKYKPAIFFEVTETWWRENHSTIKDVLDKLSVLGYRFMIEHQNEMLPYEYSKYLSRTQFNLMATIR